MAKFITFEGIEKCGKSTQIKKLKEDYPEFVYTKEPGGSSIGPEIRNILQNPKYKITSHAELALFYAERFQHINDIILPALNQEKNVICDRFDDSTYAYQHFGRGTHKELIDFYSRQLSIRPDLTILIDISVEEMVKRLNKVKHEFGEPDRFEQEKLDFHERIRSGYLKLASMKYRIKLINGLDSIENVYKQVKSTINDLLK